MELFICRCFLSYCKAVYTKINRSEELVDAAKVIPQSMLWTLLCNGLLGFIMIITFCFTAGDLESMIVPRTGDPYIEVFRNATGSNHSATVMAVIVVIMAGFCHLTMVATASRQLFAFARDNGLPFSGFLSYVSIIMKPNLSIRSLIICYRFIQISMSP